MTENTSLQVLGTGLTGLVASKVTELLNNGYEFENIDVNHPTQPTDITNFDQVLQRVSSSPAQILIHFAAYTDVGKSWEQRDDKTGPAYMVNVVGTQNLVKAVEQTGKHLIHISTAYIFDGEKEEPYTEEDAMHPIEWYGQTKAWAEEAVQSSSASWTILRIDQPFRSDFFPRLDVIHRIIDGLQKGTLPPQFTNHWVGPTFIDDFAQVIKWAVDTKTTGVFHASSGEKWTDYDLALAVQQQFQLPGEIGKGDLNEYLQKSNRPYQRNTSMSTEKLRAQLPNPQVSVREAIGRVQLSADANQ
jgi:dTDP-4-dehydrorhamnose reductase